MALSILGKRMAAGLAAMALMSPHMLGAGQVGLVKIDGAIGPATATYISRAVDEAAAAQDACLIIQLDTPGGLLDSTKEIVEKLLSDAVPTVVYVAPAGSTAASAGTFITLAADVAAMAPDTTIGAAHPVSFTGGDEGGSNDVHRTKMENYASSYIDTIASKRGHNVAWAKAAVLQSACTNAEAALRLKVIDIIAPDMPSLLKQLDQRHVGQTILHTAGAQVVEIPMAVREKIFQMLWHPEVMFVLMLVAIYGIIGELSNPGAILPGVAGAVALILALYMSTILPINIAGLALILLAVALFVIDVFAVTHGVLTGGGIIAFFLGSIMLFDRNPAFQLSLGVIIPATVLTAAFFLFIIGAGLRAQFLPAKTGPQTMLGKTAAALTAIDQAGGQVMIDGEYWKAVSQIPLAKGAAAEIVGIEGLTLHVKPKS
ncbi:MAG: nodulation protein NfeD [Verrucomicrobiota bacterium]|jgi:membrane-bound serine protease (ClpP class)